MFVISLIELNDDLIILSVSLGILFFCCFQIPQLRKQSKLWVVLQQLLCVCVACYCSQDQLCPGEKLSPPCISVSCPQSALGMGSQILSNKVNRVPSG